MRFFILAGGKGERLFPFTSVIPKVLMPVGGIPCVRRIVDQLLEQGFDDIVLCINRWSEAHFKHEFRDLDVKYSISEEGLGTAGEIFCARKLVNDTFGVIYADDLTILEYGELIKRHNRDAAATIALTSNVPLEFGVVKVEDGLVVSFKEKPSSNEMIWTGTAIFEPEALTCMGVGRDISRDVFPELLARGEKIYTYINDNEWTDIGNIAHYKKANELFKQEKNR